MNHPTYQLTKYPVGSIRESLTVSWPLILGLLSMSIMLFVDRLLLSRYSVNDLAAASSSGTASYAFLVLPISIASISEVFVGRYHGEERHGEIGKPIWQMLWFSLMMVPLFALIGIYAPSLIFYDSENIKLESDFFRVILYFSGFLFANVGISGFFVGVGHMRSVAIVAIIANLCNIGLDYLFIYGWGVVPEMGARGAALATGISEVVQFLILMAIFLKRSYREKFGTLNWRYDSKLFLEAIRIGVPSGCSFALEVFAHFFFFRMMAVAGGKNPAIAAVAQSIYFLVFFLYEGLSKGVMTICANLFGGNQIKHIGRVIKSAITIQIFFALIIAIVLSTFSDQIIDSFFSDKDEKWLFDPLFIKQIKVAFFWMNIFFLFDGFYRILSGHLTAAGDTLFLLRASIFLNLFAFALPIYISVKLFGGGADDGWMIIAFYGLISLLVFTWRYRSKRWLESSERLEKGV